MFFFFITFTSYAQQFFQGYGIMYFSLLLFDRRYRELYYLMYP